MSANSNFEQIEADVLDGEKITEAIHRIKPDFLFYLAAQPLVAQSVQNPLETFKTNTIGIVNTLEALRLEKISCSAIFATTDSYWFKSKSNLQKASSTPYQASKEIAEIILASYYRSFFCNSNTRIYTVKTGNLIGGGDWTRSRIIPDCMHSWKNNQTLVLNNPHSYKPYQHVLNVLSGYLEIGEALSEEQDLNGGTYTFNPEQNEIRTTQELVEEVLKHWKMPDNTQPYKYASNIEDEQKTEHSYTASDTNALPIAWSPTLNFEETVKFTASWYQQFYQDEKSSYDLTIRQIKEFEELSTRTKG